MGLVSSVHEPDALFPEAVRLATELGLTSDRGCLLALALRHAAGRFDGPD